MVVHAPGSTGEACREYLAAYRAGKLTFEAFERLCLSLGVHHQPRAWCWAKMREAEDGFGQAKKTDDEATKSSFLGRVSYWRNALAGWDFWAQRCRAHGLEPRIVESNYREDV